MPEVIFSLEPPIDKEPGVSFRILLKNKESGSAPLEKEAIATLEKEEKRCALVGKNLAPTFRVSTRNAFSLLKLLAATGKLHWKGVPLVGDFFTLGTVKWISLSDHLEPVGCWKKKELLLKETEFIGRGPPHFVIHTPFLRFFEEGVTFDMLTKKEEKPKIIEPLPFLLFQDVRGAFAHLFFDYAGDLVSSNDLSATFKSSISQKNTPRDKKGEQQIESDLLEIGYQRHKDHYYCPIPKVKIAVQFLLECGWNIHTSKRDKLVLLEEMECSLHSEGASLALSGSFKMQDSSISLEKVICQKEPFPLIKEGLAALLPQKWEKLFVQAGEMISDTRFPKAAFGKFKPLLEQLPHLKLDHDVKGLFEKPKISLPDSSFTGILRSYQQEAVDWLSHLYHHGFHALLADEMGLGKTVEVLAFLSKIPGPHLVILPTSLLFNWKEEIKRFYPSTPIYLHHGLDRKTHLPLEGMTLTSYGTLKNDPALFQEIAWNCLILDEAQNIKNRETQNFQGVASIPARFRLAITGTPIENRVSELCSLFHFLMPDLLKEEEKENSLLSIKQKISPFILRRKKEEVAKDLPPKIEQTIYLEMNIEQKTLYQKFFASAKAGALKKISLEGKTSRFEILEIILRLRQVCVHPLLLPSLFEESKKVPSVKMEALLEDIEGVIESKRSVLIYSQFTQMLSLVGEAFKDKQWPFLMLTGETRDRETLVHSFQKKEVQIFLLSLKAGGVGLNLTAADTVILLDPWWNLAVENQAIDRAHRIGQERSVFIKRYILRGTLEEKIEALKLKKKAFSDDLFNEASITDEELLELLS